VNQKLEETQNTVIIKFVFLITALAMLTFFLPAPALATDFFHDRLGYYPPPQACLQCHATLLVDNHKSNCWTCHNTDYSYSLKFCVPGNYPPDLDFTTVCANYQTGIKEPFSCSDCHVSAGDHTAAHDQTLFPSIDCSQCHVADVPIEHGKYGLSCSSCHNSTNSDVKNAIASGKSGNPVYCADCHGLIDHLTHKNAYLPNSDCMGCHLTDIGLRADIINEHAKKNTDCSVCHNSSDPTIKAAISKGIAGNSVYCADCHTQFANHAHVHDQTILTSPSCGACHVANAVSEHQGHGPHSIGCLPCHTNADPEILNAIYNGMASQSISCGNCHSLTGNRVPIANCGDDRVAPVGIAAQFLGSASYDHDGTIVSYQWNFGDGSPTVSGSSVSHIFAVTGAYQVTLTVTDNQGAADTDTCIITVNKIPIILLGCECNIVPDCTIKRGSNLSYKITVANNTDEAQSFKFASRLTLPNGKKYPASGFLVGPVTVSLEPRGSKSSNKSLFIPANAPSGNYTYHGYVGKPGNIYDECQFQFTVTQ
jgi:hypothetical protein